MLGMIDIHRYSGNIVQGCALRVPGCLRRLTFAFGQPDSNFISFI